MITEVGTEIHPLLGHALQTPALLWQLAQVFGPIVVLAVITGIFHFVLGGRGWSQGRKGLWPLIVGKDKRLSTSKVQVTLWTFAIGLALLYLLFFGKDFGALELQPEYLLLLGSPAAAALLAKTFTSTKVSEGTLEKTEKPAAQAPSPTEVVTNDEGEIDLFDFQYFLFNLLLLVWFAVEMFRTLYDASRLADAGYFLPPLPLSLVGLTSVSAAGYVAKKGLKSDPPIIDAVSPSLILLGKKDERITITGANFGDRDPGDPPANTVLLNGRPLDSLRVSEWGSRRIQATAPEDPAELGIVAPDGAERSVNLEVQDRFGRKSEAKSVSVTLSTPVIRSTDPVNGARGVPLEPNVRATFSENMDQESVKALGAFTLIEQTSNLSVGATVGYHAASKSATLSPENPLAAGTTYTATVKGGSGGVKNLAGNPLAGDHTWSFTTV